LEGIAKTPWIEAALSVFTGLVLLIFGKTDLAQVTWIIGIALSFTRYAFSKKLEEEMSSVRNLASIIDLERQIRVDSFLEMVRVYLEISEPEFRTVKDGIVKEASDRLSTLAREKTSEELATGEYFTWLFDELRSTVAGSRIWAISMMLEIEWLESQVEQTFLDLQLTAAGKGVDVERIFVVRRKDIPQLLSNKYIKAQFEKAGKRLRPLVVEREYLETHDPTLLSQLGDGLMGIDARVVLIDISSPTGYRGRVTMNPSSIASLQRMYTNLRSNARPMADAIRSLQTNDGTGAVV
jgi:hypothetical protein